MLKQSILYFFLILFFKISTIVYGQGGFCNEQSDILSIDLTNELINSNPLKLTNYKGFPVLRCTFNDGGCEFPKDRYLVKSKEGEYFVIDSNYRIIIESSDSIIAFSDDVYFEDSLIDVACSPDYRGRMKIYYQAIRHGFTNLYDYQGKSITTTPYEGEIFVESQNFESNSSYWVTVTYRSDSMKLGLIDSTGTVIIPQELITRRIISHFDYFFNEIWFLKNTQTSEAVLYNAKSREEILSFDANDYYKGEYTIFIFKLDNKYGIFHPLKGVLIAPKYDSITIIDNTNDSFILKKGRKEKKWFVPQEIKEYYKLHKLIIN
jgi:hypothetical protein